MYLLYMIMQLRTWENLQDLPNAVVTGDNALNRMFPFSLQYTKHFQNCKTIFYCEFFCKLSYE